MKAQDQTLKVGFVSPVMEPESKGLTMSLSKKLKEKGLKKLPQRKPNPLPLRPEILLHPNIPKPLHGVNPRSINGVNWWNRQRRVVYQSTEYHCLSCGVHKLEAKYHQWLEAHEIYDVDYQRGVAKFVEIVPLCHFCHNYIHDGRLTDLLTKGLIHHHKFASIIKHGDEVLRKAGLSRPSKIDRDLAVLNLEVSGKLRKWNEWRLIIGRKKYKPLYASFEEWKIAHDVGEFDE